MAGFAAGRGFRSAGVSAPLRSLLLGCAVCALLLLSTDLGAATLSAFNPAAYWPFDESAASPTPNIASNSSTLGSAPNGYIVLDVDKGQAGIVGNAARFHNSSNSVSYCGSKIDIPWNPSLNPSPPFTIEFWAKPASLGSDSTGFTPISSMNPYFGNRSGWLVYVSNAGRWQFRLGNESGYAGIISASSGNASTGVWQHVACVYNGTTASIWINGQLAGSGAVAGFKTNGWFALRIGGTSLMGDLGNIAGNRGWDGWMDEVAIYASALSGSTIAAHYSAATTNNAGYAAQILASNPVGYWRLDEPAFVAPATGAFPTVANLGTLGSAANGTNTLGVVGAQPGVGFSGFSASNKACLFNGEVGHLSLANPPSLSNVSGQLTMMAWIKPTVKDWYRDIIAQGYDGSGQEIFLRINAQYGTNTSYYEVGSANATNRSAAIFPIPAADMGNWVFLAGTEDGTSWNLYRNGALVAVANDDVGPLVISNRWSVGSRSDPTDADGYVFGGMIDEPAIFTNALSAANIQSIYNSAFAAGSGCQTNSWTIGSSGKWEGATNWILGVAPDSSQCIIYITNAGSDLVLSGLPAKRVLFDATTSTYVSNMTVQDLVLSGAGPSVVNWLALTNATTNVPLHVLNQLSMGAGSQLTVDSSSLQVDGVLGVGAQPAPGFTNNFPATFSIDSGWAQIGTLVVGPVASNGVGTLNVSGGALLVNNLGIGNNGATNLGSGTGTATVGNGATLSVSSLSLGSTAGGLGSLVMSNGSSLLVGSNLNLVSGSLSSTSSVSITGGSLLASNGLVQIGPAGSGQLLISGGIHTLRQVRLGSGDTNGSGFLHLSGGLLTVLGTGTGPGAGLDANLIVIDGGDLNGSGTSLTVGDAHSAEVDVSGDGAAQFATVYVGYSPNYTGTYAQSGGSMAVSSTLVVGDCTSGAIGNATLTGGILFVTNATHTAVLDVRYGTFALNPGSTLVVDNLLTNSSCGNFVNNGGTLLPWSGVPGLGTLHTTNLLLNPGAETGNFSYWTLGGDTPYLVVDTGYNYSGIPPHSGTYEFAGGGDNESLSQAVALVGNQGITAAAIDTGKLLASISFWEQGAGFYAPGFNDDADVKIEFLDGNFNTLTARTTPQIDSGVSFVWSNYTAQYVIPIGTRSIRYTMEFILKEALHEFNYDVCVDDNSLIISSPPSLNLVVAGPNVVLTWPAWGTNYLLQSTISLSLPNSWQTVTTVPVATQNGLVVTDPLHGPARFYRLSTPVVP